MITGTQLRMARAAVRLGVRDIAKLANVSPATVTRLEGGAPANSATIQALKTAYEDKGILFIGDSWVRARLPEDRKNLSDDLREIYEKIDTLVNQRLKSERLKNKQKEDVSGV
ncbi:predicted transcriptional regulators [Acetobacter aceti NRIC 0242]|nr:helix-turn-helix domain-containing protein [Acetobacter aceti]GBO81607.1 predicted transcriptional regulators [Acetobacter aceti NRIC 0242]